MSVSKFDISDMESFVEDLDLDAFRVLFDIVERRARCQVFSVWEQRPEFLDKK